VLLRHVDARRHAGSGPFHHAGRGRRLGADSDCGFLRHQVDLRNFWLQVRHAGAHSAQRKSGCFRGNSIGLRLEFDNVSIAFDEKVVLDRISFQLPHGETKALFGVAGSGKSTLLKLAMGLMRPDSGRIFALGEEVTRMSEQELFKLRGAWASCSRRARFSTRSRSTKTSPSG
jgi:ABC-type multidrug transport system fused ATPase/permease subunit